MDKEQRRRAAYRTIIEDPEGDGAEIYLTVRVSGEHVELHRQQEMPWDDEHGTGNDVDVEMWPMSLGTLKRLIESVQICIAQSETFEKTHPAEKGRDIDTTV